MMECGQNTSTYGVTGQIIVAKKATAVVEVVSNIADAAFGSAIAAISSVDADCFAKRAFFHLSTATNTSSAPKAAATKTPIKLRNGKLITLINTIAFKIK